MDEVHYKVLKIIEENPQISQRQLAKELNISLGKVNYCLRALLAKGWVKAGNFRSKKNKMAYAYLLTPGGLEAKAKLTASFLRKKKHEYELLRKEIRQLQDEMSAVEDARHRG